MATSQPGPLKFACWETPEAFIFLGKRPKLIHIPCFGCCRGEGEGEDRRIFHQHGALVLGAQERGWAASVSQGLGRRTAEAHAGGVAYVSV